MSEIPQAIKRELRQIAAKAHEAELSATLAELEAEFKSWREGKLDPFELEQAIHKFHNGAAREIYNTYNGSSHNLPWTVVRAINEGIISRDDVPERVLDYIAPHLQALKEFRR